MKNTGSVL